MAKVIQRNKVFCSAPPDEQHKLAWLHVRKKKAPVIGTRSAVVDPSRPYREAEIFWQLEDVLKDADGDEMNFNFVTVGCEHGAWDIDLIEVLHGAAVRLRPHKF